MPDFVKLEGRLAHTAYRFDFFQVMRLLECLHAERPRFGQSLRPSDDPVRLGQAVELGFAPTEVTRYQPATAGSPARLTVSFIGLLGANGPMPLHLTEYVRGRVRYRNDRTLSSFLDVFHHRMLSLFYRSWSSSQPVVSFDRPHSDSFARYVGSLCGLGSAATRGRDSIGELAKLHFSSLLASKVRHASGLGLLLSQYFGVPVAIQQFVGQWLRLPEPECTRFGAYGAKALGQGQLLGRRVWDRQNKFRIVIGPLQAADYHRLQPDQPAFRRLAEWVRVYTGGLLDWDVQLRLTPGAATAMRLNGRVRLSRTTWLGEPAVVDGYAALRFQPDSNIFQSIRTSSDG